MRITHCQDRQRSRRTLLAIPIIAALLALPGALLADSAFLGRVTLEVGSVQTSGEAPLLTKTAALRIENHEEAVIENVRATLQPDAQAIYTIVEGVVEVAGVGAGDSEESEQTFAVQLDTSIESTRSVLLQWVLDFDVAGEPQQISTPVILDVPEMGQDLGR